MIAREAANATGAALQHTRARNKHSKVCTDSSRGQQSRGCIALEHSALAVSDRLHGTRTPVSAWGMPRNQAKELNDH